MAVSTLTELSESGFTGFIDFQDFLIQQILQSWKS